MTDVTDGGLSRWKTFGERTIYDSPWVWLGQVDVELLDEQDRVLLLWRHRFVQDQWGWEIPGGLIEAGEEPDQTAVRELAEETGYRAGRVEPLITFQPMVGTVDSKHIVFIGRDVEKIGEPTERNELERMEWVPLAAVPGLIEAGQIWNAASLVPVAAGACLKGLALAFHGVSAA